MIAANRFNAQKSTGRRPDYSTALAGLLLVAPKS
jgi:hypothetical protein